MTTHPLARTIAATCVLGLIGAACAGDSDGFEPGAPIPTDTTDSTAGDTSPTSPDETPLDTAGTATTSTSTSATTNPEPPDTSATDVAGTSTTATEPAPEPSFTPQAPGFDFPPADLETDPGSPNNNRVVDPEDEPILDAYFEAALAQTAVFSEWPLDPSSPVLDDAPFTDRVRDGFGAGLAERTQLNQVLDVSGGSTSRPYVIDDDDGDPDRVIVWDCQVDATFWKDIDTGEKAPPEPGGHPNAGPPGVEIGTSTALVLRDGRWLVDEGGYEPRACSP